jgi:lipopolysaccharide export system ATP-binding protein
MGFTQGEQALARFFKAVRDQVGPVGERLRTLTIPVKAEALSESSPGVSKVLKNRSGSSGSKASRRAGGAKSGGPKKAQPKTGAKTQTQKARPQKARAGQTQAGGTQASALQSADPGTKGGQSGGNRPKNAQSGGKQQETVKLKPVQPRDGPPMGPRLVAETSGLVVSNIGKSFKGRPVVRGVSLKLQRGEVLGLLGPNGAGKTTSFYMITGLVPADYGTIELDGHEITGLPMYRRARLGIGYLPQETSIFRGLTVEDNLRAIVELVEPLAGRRQELIDDLLAEFSIEHLRHTPALALSGGERRRVEIARAIASHPSFILLDEPFAGIDPIAIGEIRQLVSHLKNRGLGVLITDHNVRETLDIIDRAVIIHDGQVLMEGDASEIVGNEDVRRVYLGDRFSL